MSTNSGVQSSIEGSSLILKLNRPEAGQSLSLAAAEDLLAYAVKNKNKISGLILMGEGPRVFCSGGDLKAYAKLKTRAQGVLINRKIRKTLDFFAKLPIPKIVLLKGDCFGGGMELISCFDQIFACPHVLLGFWQRRLSLTPGWGGYARWSSRLTEKKLKDLLVEARSLSAEESLSLGLIHRIYPEGLIEERAKDWLVELNQKSPETFKGIQNLSNSSEQKIFAKLWTSQKPKNY